MPRRFQYNLVDDPAYRKIGRVMGGEKLRGLEAGPENNARILRISHEPLDLFVQLLPRSLLGIHVRTLATRSVKGVLPVNKPEPNGAFFNRALRQLLP